MTIYLLIFITISLLTTRRPGVLGCGLIGFVPNKKNTANLDWVKLIMAYNAHRGTDSCGLFMNNELKKGVGTESDIRIFMAKNKMEYDPKSKNNLIIAHSRKATFGTHTEANAHPFHFEHNGREIIIAHNGTISNSIELAKEFNVDTNGLVVDSQRLGKIILEKGYEVLNKYKGSAALLFTFADEPNVMYAFKGGSKDKATDIEISEERPLFFIQNNEGTYISSMREPLDAASNQDLIVYTFKENIVYKIENNNLFNVFEAKREDANISFTVPTKSTDWNVYKSTTGSKAATGTINLPSASYVTSKKVQCPMDFYEEIGNPIVDWYANAIYFMGGRYYSIPVNRKQEVQDKYLKASIDGIEDFLLDGPIKVSKQNHGSSHPFVYPTSTNNDYCVELYFYQGIMIRKDKLQKFKSKMRSRFDNMTNIFEKLKQLSAYSCHPITFLYSEALKLKEKELCFYYGGKLEGAGFKACPYSIRRYQFDDKAKLVSISSQNSSDIIIDYVDDGSDEPEYEDLPNVVYSFDLEDQGFARIYRYKGHTKEAEDDLIIAEEWDGIAEVYYYCEADENISFNGYDAMVRAIQILLCKLILSDDGKGTAYDDRYIEERALEILKEGLTATQGLISFMNNQYPSCDFESLILEAVQDIALETFDELYTEIYDEVDAEKTTIYARSNDKQYSRAEEIGNESLS